MASETPSIPLVDLISNKSLNNPLPLLQKIFPDLHANELETVVSLKLGLRLPRRNSALVKWVSWNPSRSSRSAGFSKEVIKEYLGSIASVADRLGDDWSKDKLDVIPSEIQRDWSQGVNNANHRAWMLATSKSQDGSLFQAPPLDPSVKGQREFLVEVRPVVVNPDRPQEVWQAGSPIEIPSAYASWSSSQQEQWWEQQMAQSERWKDEFGISALPRVLRPEVSLRWNVVSPDGASRAYDDRVVNSVQWKNTSAGVSWTQKRLELIVAAYEKAGVWAVLKHCEDNDVPVHLYGESSSKIISPTDWDLFDQTAPANMAQFDQMMVKLKSANPDGFERINKSLSTFLMTSTLHAQAWKKQSWRALDNLRQWYDSRPWVDDKMIETYVDSERNAFVLACREVKNLPGYASQLSDDDKEIFKGLLYWNECDFSSMLSEALVLERDKVQDVVVEDVQTSTPAPQDNVSKVDWSALCEAFGVTEPSVEERAAHPFNNWMDRLAPPSNVKDVTRQWLADNERFNDINRLILRKKDTDEASLNADLAEKLKNVIMTSNSIMEENQRSGGWWGRIRKGFNEGASPEKWADSFLDFQNHMLVMFDAINKQVERDRVWLKYADGLGNLAGDVDARWSGWLVETAQGLEQERESAVNEKSISSEKKIEWNNRIDLLDSARVAHEHIKTANGITMVLLEKVRQSADIKERLQQRSMMFYWSSLNMFAGLQSLQRNTNAIFEQQEMVDAMSKSFQAMTTRSLHEEAEQKEKIRQAFKKMTESEAAMKQFYEGIASFQKDAVSILGDLNASRDELQEETIAVALSPQAVKNSRKKSMAMEVSIEPSDATRSSGPKP